AGVFHPRGKGVVRLRGKVDEDAPAGLVDRGLDDRVERLDLVDRHCGSERRIEAHQGAVRSIGVETEKGELLVDQVLGEDPGHQRLADSALLAADEMNVRCRHRGWSYLAGPPAAASIVFSTALPATLTVLPTTAPPTDTAAPAAAPTTLTAAPATLTTAQPGAPSATSTR